MKTIESVFSNHVVKSTNKALGDVFYFSHFAIIEFNEGVHIDIHNSTGILDDLIDYFGVSRPFGIISNRINSYSVDILDAKSIVNKIENLHTYAVVAHDLASQMSAEIERSFCLSENIIYSCLDEAIYKVYDKVKGEMITYSD
ncbi:hypothetical protein VOI54_17110 [Tamlana sp. 2201CG12-4]|uniref:hypothetical protein n=1 Tax=Tamlana sp. 2201CG12-4 TaxID=3112582 RepID=UPI002DBA5159|nr:hypothetical protein [Tamlana sp. 2201CG12-4]MEC3908750.1 hypothetical protein [Tamlana sp. 2201CG12-4]